MGVCVSATGAGKVTPVANIRRNGNWFVTVGRRCENKQSDASSGASLLLQISMRSFVRIIHQFWVSLLALLCSISRDWLLFEVSPLTVKSYC